MNLVFNAGSLQSLVSLEWYFLFWSRTIHIGIPCTAFRLSTTLPRRPAVRYNPSFVQQCYGRIVLHELQCRGDANTVF
ncbi:hypothetical protein M3J09_013043 [Ascochyta lentis]